jgi:hypothetical protein
MNGLVSVPVAQRKLLTQLDLPLQGSIAKRKIDIGIVNSDGINGPASNYRWSQIMVSTSNSSC